MTATDWIQAGVVFVAAALPGLATAALITYRSRRAERRWKKGQAR